MPYFVYRITPPKNLEKLETFDKYRDARTYARERRTEESGEDMAQIKMIFAPNDTAAEKLLTTEREPRPMGEDA